MRRAQRSQVVSITVENATAGPTPSTLSSALARILEQLNPTAWLPAAVVVGDLALVLAYSSKDGRPTDRWASIGALLDRKPLGVILGTLAALALVTILTQTFGYSAIRALEGYWGASRSAARVVSLGIRWQAKRQRRLLDLRGRLEARALVASLPTIKRSLASKPLVATAIEYQVMEIDLTAIDPAIVKLAAQYLEERRWERFVPPTIAHQISEVDRQLDLFPRADRLMPTKLGLSLRLAEDQLLTPSEEGNLRGFVTRHLGSIDPRLLADHDEHRNRLDMHAVLTFASLFLLPANYLLLRNDVSGPVITVLSLAIGLLAWSSYRGAVAAAGEYGESLLAIDKRLNDSRAG